MNYKNYMEDVIVEVLKDFYQQYPEYCCCERCKADTIVIALSNLRGKYAVSPEGEVFARLSRDDRQVRADALRIIIEAAQQVSQNPHH
jgi:competence protein ComFB